ncbi:peptidase M48 Ste24p domain protein [Acinetobacter baumannii]|nr:peptidase M48 Ste24p domain protein [Acinetobacter baumannii]
MSRLMESARPMTRKSSFAICAISWPSTPVNSRSVRLRSRPSVSAMAA